jgi:hypothetical protein
MKLSSGKIKDFSNKALGNKYVLYIVLFLAITNILGYMMMGDIRVLAFFALVGFVVSKFSKNMIIILGASMIATNFFLVGRKVSTTIEDMSGRRSIEGMSGRRSVEGMSGRRSVEGMSGRRSVEGMSGNRGSKKEKKGKKQGLSNMNNEVVAKNAKPVSSKERVDYATTVEQAYDNLENIVGKGGISKLTDDTSRLMDKQNKMFENLKGMGPLIGQYKEMMGSMNMDNINKLTSTLIGK